MALPWWLLVLVGGRRFKRSGPSPNLGSLGPSHQRCHKSRVSLRSPLVPMVFRALLMERCPTPTKVLKYWFKTPFTCSSFPTIWEWKVVLIFGFIPTFLDKCIQNAFVNFGSRSDIIISGNPWCLNLPLKIAYAVSNAVAVPTLGTICSKLANRTTITKMVSHPCGFGKLVIKSMHIQCHGHVGIGNDSKSLPWFW